MNRLVMRLDDEELAKVDSLRGALSRPAYMRRLLRDAGALARGDVASHGESLELLTALARDGRTPAAVALERALRSTDNEQEGDAFDELARRRGIA